MKYQWAVATVTIEGVEAATGRKVLSVATGNITVGWEDTENPDGTVSPSPVTVPNGIEIEFDRELNPGEKERLRIYLTTAGREKLVERTW